MSPPRPPRPPPSSPPAGSSPPPGAATHPSAGPLPPEAYAVALASLPGMGPTRLLDALRRLPPAAAWQHVVDGRGHPDPSMAASWKAAAACCPPGEAWRRCAALGVDVVLLGDVRFPAVLAADPVPPAVLFSAGDLGALDGPRVAVVGTRRCTRYGRDVAAGLGADLADAGVRVVSGLAAGIDGAAHTGALSAGAAPPVGVVGSGLDVVYPRRHAELWRRVAAAGVLLGEAPPAARPERWRFPARNRLIAALADVVVVVESHAAGGAMLTVNEAQARDRTVMAVPGPVTSRASEGTNDLLTAGAHVARDAGDVLTVLGLGPGGRRGAADPRPAPDPADAAVLEAMGWQPVTADDLASSLGLDLAAVAVALGRLAAGGWVAGTGGWWERVAAGRGQKEGAMR